MKQAYIAGTAAMTAYELLYVYPNWQELVSKPLKTSGLSYQHAVGLLALFGAVYNVHRYFHLQSAF